jgi:hypothetical protein
MFHPYHLRYDATLDFPCVYRRLRRMIVKTHLKGLTFTNDGSIVRHLFRNLGDRVGSGDTL